MIIIIDHQKTHISAIKKIVKSRFYCAVAGTSEQLKNLLMSMKPVAVIANVETLEDFENGWLNLLLLNQVGAKVVLLANGYSQQQIEDIEEVSVSVIDPESDLKKLDGIIAILKGKNDSISATQVQQKQLSRLRDHMFSELLEGYDQPQETPQMMEFLGLTSPIDKYYLSVVISFTVSVPEGHRDNVWESALRIQEIAREEISKIAISRSCIRSPDRIAFVLLIREPGDLFRYELEEILEVIHKRIARECGHKIEVGVGLADKTVSGIALSYRQACDALEQGRYLVNSFVCFYCDLYDCNTRRFQMPKGFKEQIVQHLYHGEMEQIDKLLEDQFHQLHANGLVSGDNIMALKIDMSVLFMDILDKLAINTERSAFYSRLINEFLTTDSLSSLEFVMKQYLRHMTHLARTENDKRVSRIVRQAQVIINDQIAEPINVQIMAQYLKISPNYLSAIFKSETGMRLSEYITNVKMQEAARQIRETNRNIAEISANLGYESANYFSKLFKKQYGVNPSEYRRIYRKEAK